jgi:hypothetical protein
MNFAISKIMRYLLPYLAFRKHLCSRDFLHFCEGNTKRLENFENLAKAVSLLVLIEVRQMVAIYR